MVILKIKWNKLIFNIEKKKNNNNKFWKIKNKKYIYYYHVGFTIDHILWTKSEYNFFDNIKNEWS